MPSPLLICFLLLLAPAAIFSDTADLAGELSGIQSRSRSGVIQLNDQLIYRYLSSVPTPRPYSFLIFFDAADLHGRPEFRLTDLNEGFSLLASSFIANNNENPNSRSKLFFGHVEIQASESIFRLFNVTVLPHIRLVNPNVEDLRDGDQMASTDFSRLAESMSEFVESRTGLSVGPFVHPPDVSRKHLIFADDLAGELSEIQSRSRSGVIQLNDQLVHRFLSSVPAPRPYSFLIFFDAAHLHSRPEFRLVDLNEGFSLLASSFIANNNENPNSRSKLFFGHVEFKQSESIFRLFNVTVLPHIRLVNPNVEDLRDGDQMDYGDFSRMAESMAEFVESRTRLSVGPIVHPPMVSRKQLIFAGGMVALWTPYAIKRMIAGDTVIHDKKFWLVGTILVYFFSVGGTMHNIIRKMPMFLADRNDPTKVVFFYQGSGMQLGVEGFAVGILYTVVGLLLAFVSHALVRVRNVQMQQLLMVSALFLCFWAVKKVVVLDYWKTGYGIHAFWPSS